MDPNQTQTVLPPTITPAPTTPQPAVVMPGAAPVTPLAAPVVPAPGANMPAIQPALPVTGPTQPVPPALGSMPQVAAMPPAAQSPLISQPAPAAVAPAVNPGPAGVKGTGFGLKSMLTYGFGTLMTAGGGAAATGHASSYLSMLHLGNLQSSPLLYAAPALGMAILAKASGLAGRRRPKQ